MLKIRAVRLSVRLTPLVVFIAGKDPQLERAVDEAMKLLKSHPANRMMTEPPSPEWGKRKSGS